MAQLPVMEEPMKCLFARTHTLTLTLADERLALRLRNIVHSRLAFPARCSRFLFPPHERLNQDCGCLRTPRVRTFCERCDHQPRPAGQGRRGTAVGKCNRNDPGHARVRGRIWTYWDHL